MLSNKQKKKRLCHREFAVEEPKAGKRTKKMKQKAGDDEKIINAMKGWKAGKKGERTQTHQKFAFYTNIDIMDD